MACSPSVNTNESAKRPPSIDIDGSEEKRAHVGHDQLKITAISRIGFEPISSFHLVDLKGVSILSYFREQSVCCKASSRACTSN
uniref:Uncharacterized protein n=1 Tax=Utricularia reniformis TaxID=192314 RepID=A0A1Y0B3T8_9LAMI|nr:hypothetical protein AEK19_MT0820 [Utricularia reniformis]YP_009382318.1 hypothetical protein AEK19_MT1890 [Utricularia reniformis]ART31054.1 hypothetical protein AEK19_MT0820 [Utricularia reniformis]ART32058.1 hypothetical protein AEK19_MT1890 [Utricularia reniformis]